MDGVSRWSSTQDEVSYSNTEQSSRLPTPSMSPGRQHSDYVLTCASTSAPLSPPTCAARVGGLRGAELSCWLHLLVRPHEARKRHPLQARRTDC